jgi:hypothetical protein
MVRFARERVLLVIVPAVTTRTIARSTMPFATFGSSICSQIATLKPFETSFGGWPSTARTAPAIGPRPRPSIATSARSGSRRAGASSWKSS